MNTKMNNMESIVKIHRERAINAFRNAMLSAEASLKTSRSKSPNSMEDARELLDLAELHLHACDVIKAESGYTKALEIFCRNTDEEENVRIVYISYILKTLSGIHTCFGRRREAEKEMTEAIIWEERLKKL